jgi:DNA polymerase III delta prime subunit
VDDDNVSDDPISEMDDDSPRKPRSRKKELFVSYSNVVILAGPHGVGKSAAVHAVAEELGYQVFEISPGSRRGWKEVMEAVGEVGQSELVTRHKSLTTEPSLAPLKLGDPGLGELKSRGRKGLVCFDEVDVLYEEDKGFWTCVTGLVEKSRRPVIITCNGIPPSTAVLTQT